MTKSVEDLSVQPREKYSCFLMGDSRTGKKSPIEAYGRTVAHANLLHMPDYTCVYVSAGAEKVELDVHDSPVHSDGRFLHMFSSQFADVIVMAFSVVCKDSFQKVENLFIPFAKRNYPRIPVILVATDIDLRYGAKQEWIATPEMGQDLAQTVGVDVYVECSARHGNGVRILVEKAVRLAKKHRREERVKKRKCSVM